MWIELEVGKRNKPGTERQALYGLTHAASEKADLMEGEHREAVTTSCRKWSSEERCKEGGGTELHLDQTGSSAGP